MAGQYRNSKQNVLEIRGISRGSLIDQSRREEIDESLINTNIHELSYYDHLQLGSDSDDSTIRGESIGSRGSPTHSNFHTEDTITDSSHFWSAGNSFTTGNTTERSSVYSWGDDEFDHQASRLVRQMFQAIEKMLFEGVLSGSSSLQHECREWMSVFHHLRILGKQLVIPAEEGFQFIPTPESSSNPTPTKSYPESFNSEGLHVKGKCLPSESIPQNLIPIPGRSSTQSLGNDLSHLQEEIFEQDGYVEEYLAYDIKEMDEEEHLKRYHIPRRRRLGFPPITPNACVRDSVLHQIFDILWSQVITCLTGNGKPIVKGNLLKIISDSYAAVQESMKSLRNQSTDAMNSSHEDGDEMYYDSLGPIPGITIDRASRDDYVGNSNFMVPSFSIPPRLIYPDVMGLPPSRGSYFDQGGLGNNRHPPFTSGRLSTASHQHLGDINSLNDLMKISQKKLQTRSDKISNVPDDLPPAVPPDAFPGRSSSSHHFTNGNNAINSMGITHHLSTLALGGGSPLAPLNRPLTSREMFHPTGGALNMRQPSATARKGRVGRLARLLPLDRAKTPNVDFDGFVRATAFRKPSSLEQDIPSFTDPRINSPLQSYQSPPLSNNNAGLGNTLWVNPRLPPISSNLESLNENALVDFKKTRGKTAHTRISSAIGEEKSGFKGLDYNMRPNTTHTFRDVIPKRTSSVTPSNFMFGAQGNSFGMSGLKSNSPAGLPSFNNNSFVGLSMPNNSTSPENITGLAGITGIGISMGGNNVQSPEDDHVTSSWGSPAQHINTSHVRRKRTVTGLI